MGYHIHVETVHHFHMCIMQKLNCDCIEILGRLHYFWLLKYQDTCLLNFILGWQMQRGSESQGKYAKVMQAREEDVEGTEDEDEDEHGETLCGACGENYASDEFWICCDVCEKWFHGKCVKITPARAEHIKQYKCPSCSNKRSRPWWLLMWLVSLLSFVTANCLVGQVSFLLVSSLQFRKFTWGVV